MQAIAVLIVVLLMGCLIGAAGSWLRYGKYTRVQADERWEESPLSPQNNDQRLPELLGMTSEQEAQFEDVMKESLQELDAMSREQRLRIDAVIAEANKKIRSILNDEQKTRLEKSLEDVNRRREYGSRGERGAGSPSPSPKRGSESASPKSPSSKSASPKSPSPKNGRNQNGR